MFSVFCLPGQGEATSSLVEEFEAVYRCFEEREKVNTTTLTFFSCSGRCSSCWLLTLTCEPCTSSVGRLDALSLSLSLSLPTRSHTLLLLLLCLATGLPRGGRSGPDVGREEQATHGSRRAFLLPGRGTPAHPSYTPPLFLGMGSHTVPPSTTSRRTRSRF